MVENLPVMREGLWLYEQTAPIRIQIVESPETWGTGDYEDEESIAENQPISCFFLCYTSAGTPGRFSNVVPNFVSLNAAVTHAEQVFPGISWDDSRLGLTD